MWHLGRIFFFGGGGGGGGGAERSTATKTIVTSIHPLALLSYILGVLRGARLYIVGYAKQTFLHFSILVKLDCFATLYKFLYVWAEALKA